MMRLKDIGETCLIMLTIKLLDLHSKAKATAKDEVDIDHKQFDRFS